MQGLLQQNADFILSNIKSLINAANDTELAEFFGVKPGTVSAWRSRNSLNYELLITKCKENDWDLHQIVFEKTTDSSTVNKCQRKKPEIQMNQNSQNAFIQLILEKDKEIMKLAEELGATKEELRALKKQTRS